MTATKRKPGELEALFKQAVDEWVMGIWEGDPTPTIIARRMEANSGTSVSAGAARNILKKWEKAGVSRPTPNKEVLMFQGYTNEVAEHGVKAVYHFAKHGKWPGE